jgi:hypothetical protein
METSTAEPFPRNRDKSMKTVSILSKLPSALLLCVSLALADAGDTAYTGAAKPSRPERQIILNGFRMPSIGLEYRNRSVSWHGGLYCTVVSRDKDGGNETTWFAKAGATWWPLPYLFLDLSGLYGLNKDYRDDPALMLNPGLQYAYRETVLFRLGVAVLASPDHAFKINPTPGVGIAFTL